MFDRVDLRGPLTLVLLGVTGVAVAYATSHAPIVPLTAQGEARLAPATPGSPPALQGGPSQSVQVVTVPIEEAPAIPTPADRIDGSATEAPNDATGDGVPGGSPATTPTGLSYPTLAPATPAPATFPEPSVPPTSVVPPSPTVHPPPTPTFAPSPPPTAEPTPPPTPDLTPPPTPEPTVESTPPPTAEPTPPPTPEPTVEPTPPPTPDLTPPPTPEPTVEPTQPPTPDPGSTVPSPTDGGA